MTRGRKVLWGLAALVVVLLVAGVVGMFAQPPWMSASDSMALAPANATLEDTDATAEAIAKGVKAGLQSDFDKLWNGVSGVAKKGDKTDKRVDGLEKDVNDLKIKKIDPKLLEEGIAKYLKDNPIVVPPGIPVSEWPKIEERIKLSVLERLRKEFSGAAHAQDVTPAAQPASPEEAILNEEGRAKIRQLEAEVGDLKADINRLTGENDKLGREKIALDNQLQGAKNELLRVSQLAEARRQELAKKAPADNSAEVATLKTEVEAARQREERLKKELAALKDAPKTTVVVKTDTSDRLLQTRREALDASCLAKNHPDKDLSRQEANDLIVGWSNEDYEARLNECKKLARPGGVAQSAPTTQTAAPPRECKGGKKWEGPLYGCI